MTLPTITVWLYLADFAALILYDLRAFSFCGSILEISVLHRLAKPVSLGVNCLLLAVLFYTGLPLLLGYLIIFLAILLQFCMMFQGQILTFLFGSGNFLFHLMDVQMIVSAIYILIFDISSVEEYLAYYPSTVVLSLLLVITFLEVFRRFVDQAGLRMLLGNKGQLLFATTSMMLINIYLLILSVSYSGPAYSPLSATFLLCTGLLLFGAFYTSFQHAVRMSMLLEYQIKSRTLEDQLERSYEHLAEARQAASTDALTQARSRRYGLEALARQLEEGRPGCLCFLDVDRLKTVNDRYGHEEGDRYLLRVVQALGEAMSPSDTLARLGGDEFMLLLPNTPAARARALMEGVRTTLAGAASRYPSSVSYGVLELRPGERMSVSEALRRADAEMYACKAGRLGPALPD